MSCRGPGKPPKLSGLAGRVALLRNVRIISDGCKGIGSWLAADSVAFVNKLMYYGGWTTHDHHILWEILLWEGVQELFQR